MAEIPGGKTVCARHPPPGKSPVFPGCARVRNSPPNSGDTVWYRDKGHVVSPSARSRQDAAVPAYSMLPARCASRYDLPCRDASCLPTDIMHCGPDRGRHGLIGSSCTNGLVGYTKQSDAEFLLLISTPEGHMCQQASFLWLPSPTHQGILKDVASKGMWSVALRVCHRICVVMHAMCRRHAWRCGRQ